MRYRPEIRGRPRSYKKWACRSEFLVLATGLLLPWVVPSAEVPQAATGPLSTHKYNPRYFANANGEPVYLVGSHTWANLTPAGMRVSSYWESRSPNDWEDDWEACVLFIASLSWQVPSLVTWCRELGQTSGGGGRGRGATPVARCTGMDRSEHRV